MYIHNMHTYIQCILRVQCIDSVVTHPAPYSRVHNTYSTGHQRSRPIPTSVVQMYKLQGSSSDVQSSHGYPRLLPFSNTNPHVSTQLSRVAWSTKGVHLAPWFLYVGSFSNRSAHKAIEQIKRMHGIVSRFLVCGMGWQVVIHVQSIICISLCILSSVSILC